MTGAAFDALLAPRCVAVIGASDDPTRIGGRPIAAMLRAGYAGRILPVNPRRETVQGLPCFAGIEDLPEPPEAALIALPAERVADAVAALGRIGCRAATLFSAGFAETGADGAAAERGIVALGRAHGLRLLGPNTLGVYNVDLGYFGTFSSSLDTGLPRAGAIGIASQSGAFGAHLGALARDRGLGASVLVTTGNEADITVAEAVDWMARRDATGVICAYAEAINDAPAFLGALDVARAAGKVVIVLKAGRSAVGARAAASHTASLTGDAAVADAVLRAHGAVTVRDPQTMMDIAHAAAKGVLPRRHALGVITISGGAGIVIGDEAERIGLPMPAMPEAAQARLRQVLPYAAPTNPLDCTAQVLNDPSLLETFTRAALEEGGYGAVLCFFTYVAGSPAMSDAILAAMAPLRAEYPDRIIGFCALGPPEVLARYDAAGIVVFDDPCRAVRAIDALCRIGADRARAARTEPACPRVALPADPPDEAAAKRLLAAAGIAMAPEEVATDPGSAVEAAGRLGYPVVMKILSPDIVHKSDIGGVRLDLRDAGAVRAAHGEIVAAATRHAPDARLSGVLVARHMTGGVECLMGIARDPVFGPIAVFGLGGVFVEILDDVALRPCPMDEATAREAILSIRGAPALTGARGRAPVDLDALAAMLSRLSIFAVGAGARLASVDLNPVLALPRGRGAVALDALIELAGDRPGDER